MGRCHLRMAKWPPHPLLLAKCPLFKWLKQLAPQSTWNHSKRTSMPLRWEGEEAPSGRPKLRSSVDTSLSRSTSGSPPTVPTARRCSGEQCAQGMCAHTYISSTILYVWGIGQSAVCLGMTQGWAIAEQSCSSGNRLICKTFWPWRSWSVTVPLVPLNISAVPVHKPCDILVNQRCSVSSQGVPYKVLSVSDLHLCGPWEVHGVCPQQVHRGGHHQCRHNGKCVVLPSVWCCGVCGVVECVVLWSVWS